MRNAFIKTLIESTRKNDRIMVLTGDLGYSVFEEYIRLFPRNFINCGIMEQSMIGIASGMAMNGYIPIVYSIIPFLVMRGFEQIRNDVCYQNLNVKVVGVGAGFSYGPYGHTHHALEDIALMRTLPNMTVFTPGDPYEAQACTYAMFQIASPAYLRLGKAGEPIFHAQIPKNIMEKPLQIKKGSAGALFTVSTMLSRVIETSKEIEKRYGIQLSIYSFPTIKPLQKDTIVQLVKSYQFVATFEEHFLSGGFGSAIAEILSDAYCTSPLIRFGVPDHFLHKVGKQEYMLDCADLSVETIIGRLEPFLHARYE